MSRAPVVETWMVQALAAALAGAGCPHVDAQRIAATVRVERRQGAWLALLGGNGIEVPVPVRPEEWDAAVDHLVEALAGDDAEAVDRSARGEAGWTPLWELPDRRPRRASRD